MELTGKIIKKLPLQSGQSANGEWKRQEYVLEYGDQYPKIVCFSLRGSRVEQYQMDIDDTVTIFFDVKSREWQGRYYTDVEAWKVEKGSMGSPVPPAPIGGSTNRPQQPTTPPADSFSKEGEEDSDLPF